MSIIPQETWYHERLDEIRDHLEGQTDRVGRPWYQHFERVALRILFRYPEVRRDAIEAALYHDSLMAGGRGKQALRMLGLSERSIEIIERSTPPAYRNNFRDNGATTPEDTAVYLEYIQGIIDSGDLDVILFKMADIRDSMETLQLMSDPGLKDQLHTRYVPSFQMLEKAAEVKTQD